MRVATSNNGITESYEYGSGFYFTEQLGENKQNLCLRKHMHNWDPQNYSQRLIIIACSIKNIINYIKKTNGIDTNKLEYSCPRNISIFEESWKVQQGIGVTTDPKIPLDKITSFTKNEILSIYTRK